MLRILKAIQRISTFLMVIGSVSIGSVSFAKSKSIEEFFAEKFKTDDVIVLGEHHTVVEHKVVLKRLLSYLFKNKIIDTFAFEFARAAENHFLQSYLKDPAATIGTQAEADYFGKLNRSYSNMFNVREYDEVLRLVKNLYQESRGNIQICAIDYRMTDPDNTPNGPRLSALQALPLVTQKTIIDLSGQSLEQLAVGFNSYDREAWMGVNIANCTGKKTLAFVGSGHAMDLVRLMPQSGMNQKLDWITALGYIRAIRTDLSVKSAAIAIPYFDPYDKKLEQFSFFSEKFINAARDFGDFVAFEREKLPVHLRKLIRCSDEDKTVDLDYTTLHDYWILGPLGTKIKPAPISEWK